MGDYGVSLYRKMFRKMKSDELVECFNRYYRIQSLTFEVSKNRRLTEQEIMQFLEIFLACSMCANELQSRKIDKGISVLTGNLTSDIELLWSSYSEAMTHVIGKIIDLKEI